MRYLQAQFISLTLLSLGLVFSVASQLRLPGLPLGLGELLLVLWLISTIGAPSNWRNSTLYAVLSLILIGVLFLSMGYFLTSYPPSHTRPPALHDALAYAFSAVIAINYARLFYRYDNSFPSALLHAFLLSVLIAVVLGVFASDVTGIDTVWRDPPYRWKHLSNNPNQFALMVLPLPFLALHLIRQYKGARLLIASIAGLIALTLGWYSQSDALIMSWIVGGLVLLIALLITRPRSVLQNNLRENFSSRVRLLTIVLILFLAGITIWQSRNKAAEMMAGVQIMLQNKAAIIGSSDCISGSKYNQASVRLCLWRNALVVIQYAPLTGFGPGPHSGLVKPFQGEEAHNTLLDWGSQTGLIGLAALVTYSGWVLWRVARQRRYELVAMLLALYCFSMFHLVLRQPLFWIIPLLAVELARRSILNISNTDLRNHNSQV